LRRRISKFLRRPAALFVIGVVVTLVLAVGAGIALLRTGNAQAVSDNAPLIAAVIALGGVGTAQMVSIALEDQRTRETRALEDQRTQEARDLEDQRAREAALQNYFENVGELLIEKPLLRARPGDDLSTVVRAQTLSVLEGLDPDRKRILLLFLYESGLIYERKLVVSLVAANLSHANLREANLRGANLREANLRDVSLRQANLSEANLSRADLTEADLNVANLTQADLKEAYLRGATLFEADLSDVSLRQGNLRGANLRGADLIMADLRQANLSDAALRQANLSEANLSGALEWTEEQLSEARTLSGAIMPDGQILQNDYNPDRPTFEAWLKDNESRGVD
jgi:uncharacterized protein YjbI with pentapeptide repeats